MLLEGEGEHPTGMDHLGVEVDSVDEVDGATQRLGDAGLATFSETDTDCCYAVRQGLGDRARREPWEVYVVKRDGTCRENLPAGCCAGEGCTIDCCSAAVR